MKQLSGYPTFPVIATGENRYNGVWLVNGGFLVAEL
jgi:hypothetical protein